MPSDSFEFVPIVEELARLLPILHDSEEDDDRIRAALADPICAAYAALETDEIIGAAVVRWGQPESELLYIAVAEAMRGTGVGQQMMAALLGHLNQHGSSAMLVGTANSSLDNIAFYQKCGFRMHEIRRNYFDYIQPPIVEGGIQMRDMIVFRHEPS